MKKIFLFTLIFSGILYFYGTTSYVKNEYNRICKNIYNDPISYNNCFKPYSDEQATTLLLIKVSALGLVLLLIHEKI